MEVNRNAESLVCSHRGSEPLPERRLAIVIVLIAGAIVTQYPIFFLH
jgi:hypothetical protein